MAETQTPIETLKRAQIYNCRSADPEHCKLPICADARAALEDVVLLVTAAERVRYLMDEGEEQMKTAAWTIAWGAATGALRTALAKFTGQS